MENVTFNQHIFYHKLQEQTQIGTMWMCKGKYTKIYFNMLQNLTQMVKFSSHRLENNRLKLTN
jgi:hypothetical protein